MDNGYNTEATYRFADEVTQAAGLNLKTYLPLRSRAHREAVDGPTPALGDPGHDAFTAEVKLEPFARALRETAPQVWFTALRATDTAVRAQMEPVSINPDGLIKVAPLLHWSSKDLHEYCVMHGLPNNFDYVDPTKGEDNANAACTLRIEMTLTLLPEKNRHERPEPTPPCCIDTATLSHLSNRHLDALEEETIFILREVAAAFERPALLFSGGKDSLVMLKCAEKAFGTKAAFPTRC
jgi:3'-phosphoadenosine 5'-phosphosulfate sulfotransferase (PAPS reductase)/FAD synthetase